MTHLGDWSGSESCQVPVTVCCRSSVPWLFSGRPRGCCSGVFVLGRECWGAGSTTFLRACTRLAIIF